MKLLWEEEVREGHVKQLHQVEQERKTPFEITADAGDPFYSESNMQWLKKKMDNYKAGRLQLAEHDLFED